MANQSVEKKTEGIKPWRPVSGLTHWDSDMQEMFDMLGQRYWPFKRSPWSMLRLQDISSPVVDLSEDKDDVVAKVELPGIGKDDIDVQLTERTLTIKGEKKKEEEVDEENYYRSERSYGGFSRTVELPSEVQSDKAKASFKEGVLEVRVPKTEEAKTKVKKVKVQ
jgi:HSP20 family protein